LTGILASPKLKFAEHEIVNIKLAARTPRCSMHP
jgi:hypothetical protein